MKIEIISLICNMKLPCIHSYTDIFKGGCTVACLMSLVLCWVVPVRFTSTGKLGFPCLFYMYKRFNTILLQERSSHLQRRWNKLRYIHLQIFIIRIGPTKLRGCVSMYYCILICFCLVCCEYCIGELLWEICEPV